jgi:enamine deaminase RidA (YjgF/YER057c/UK114 family)
MAHEFINPEDWGMPKGYSNGVLAKPGGLLFVAGQIGWDAEEKLVSGDFVPQFQQAMTNVMAVVTAAGGQATDICRLTIYVTDKQAYIAGIKDVGRAYRDAMGKHFPAMALVQVADLLEEGAMVEIEATAVIEEKSS